MGSAMLVSAVLGFSNPKGRVTCATVLGPWKSEFGPNFQSSIAGKQKKERRTKGFNDVAGWVSNYLP